jgi:hypothetical protein
LNYSIEVVIYKTMPMLTRAAMMLSPMARMLRNASLLVMQWWWMTFCT